MSPSHDFRRVAGGMPDSKHLDEIVLEAINDPVGSNKNLVQLVVAEFGNHAADARVLVKHLDPGNNSVSELLGPLWAVLCNKLHQTPKIPLRCLGPNYSVSHAARCFLTSSWGTKSPWAMSSMPF